MDALRRIFRALRQADAASEARLGLSSAQLFVLRELEKAEPLTVGELAARTATAQSSVSEVVARLKSKSLVLRRRSVIDRRLIEISLSTTGRELLRSAGETVQEKLLGAFTRMPTLRQALTAIGLQSWVRAAGLDGVEPSMFFES
jgi:DNA-binding MarR family transcriptional regulator